MKGLSHGKEEKKQINYRTNEGYLFIFIEAVLGKIIEFLLVFGRLRTRIIFSRNLYMINLSIRTCSQAADDDVVHDQGK